MGRPQWCTNHQYDFLIDMSIQYRAQRKANSKKTDFSNFWPMLNAQWLTKWSPRPPTLSEIEEKGGEVEAQAHVTKRQLTVRLYSS